MKKIILFMFALVSMTATAQKEVTKFLGIPVDGYKSEMKKQLISKGFTYNAQKDFFEGEFNGHDVHVFVATNNNKVWRIMICDKNTCDETDIKIRFNKLCGQFNKNEKYVPANLGETDYMISESEDISYEMLVHKKRYEASYCQVLDKATIDAITVPEDRIKSLLSEMGVDNPSDEQFKRMEDLGKASFAFDMTRKKSVWFIISENYGEYYITMYYDNEYNHSDGEDL